MNAKWMVFWVFVLMVISASQLWAGDDFNCLTNGSFEVASTEDPNIPAGWFPYSSKKIAVELSQTAPKSGQSCLKMSVQEAPNASEGIAQIIPVDDGVTYSFTVHVKNNNQGPLGNGAFGMIGIEWKNSDGKEISRTTSTEWDMSLSRTRWEPINVAEKAPRGAKTAAMTISLFDGDKGGSGSCFVDDARVEMKK